MKDGTIFAGTLTGGVFISSNSGKQWTSGGLENSDIRLLAVSDKHVFAVTNTQGVWQRLLSEITSSVKPDPKRNILNQLPFKITSINRKGTKVAIEFSIPNQENVAIKLFDQSGRQLSSIVNRHAEAGLYHYRLDTQVRGAGCYVVKLETGATSSMRLI